MKQERRSTINQGPQSRRSSETDPATLSDLTIDKAIKGDHNPWATGVSSLIRKMTSGDHCLIPSKMFPKYPNLRNQLYVASHRIGKKISTRVAAEGLHVWVE